MNDGSIIAAVIDSRTAYEKVRYHLDPAELSPMAQHFWPLIEQWYARDPSASSVDITTLREQGKRAASEKHAETMTGWIDDLPNGVSAINIAHELLELKRTAKGFEVAAAVAGQAPPEKLRELTAEYQELLSATELHRSKFTWANDDDEMLALLDRGNRIPLAPTLLNERLGGGAVPGDHILIFGRPEAGKTLFAVNMAAGLLRMNSTVLYICNEESAYKARERIICNLAICTSAQLHADPAKALRIARRRGLDNLTICHLEPGSIGEIDELLEHVKPRVVVLDQIRNITAAGGDNVTQRMETVAKGFRTLLGKHNAVGISVTQAGDKTERHGQEPPPWLGMADVDSSRTGLPATADVMIGIGHNQDMREHGIRAISLPKNKLGNTHEGFQVEIDVLRSKIL